MTSIRSHSLPTDFSAVHFCPNCWRHYPNKPAAEKCFATNEELVHKPGDMLLVDVGYGWYDGDVKWLVDRGKANTSSGRTYAAYFIVTAANHVEHRARYHIKTLGIKNGNPTGLCGWTSATHKTGTPIVRPDLAEEAKQFIGETYDHLL